jgi:hypothetical protein
MEGGQMELIRTEVRSRIQQRRRQFLVHSFLFHGLGEAIVPDKDFDRWARELLQLQKDHPDLCAELPFHELTKGLDGSLSSEAMGISSYPLEIVTAALHVLKRHKRSKLSYEKFAAKFGYRV